MKITRVKAVQAHPVPEKAYQAKGPFPDHLFRESKIVFDYEPENDENGNNLPLGATAQNNFKPIHLYCGDCDSKVLSTKTNEHEC